MFGAYLLPVDPEAVREAYKAVHDSAVPRWAWSPIGNRVGNHNGNRAVRQAISAPNSWFYDLRGKQTRMVSPDERRKYK